MSPHGPRETVVDTITVACAENGILEGGSPEGEDMPCPILADVEAWCAELRRLGAGDGLLLEEADGLTVTLNRA